MHAFIHECKPGKHLIPVAKEEIIVEGFSQFLVDNFKIKIEF
jgi:hypothetical protein